MADGFTLSDLEDGVVAPTVEPVTPAPEPEVEEEETPTTTGFTLDDLGVLDIPKTS